jgi:queuine tRNA-ribosyltransferase
MFDCVIPTRSGRTGRAYTSRGVLNLRNARFAEDPEPLDPDCTCPACRNHSRAYIHHLIKAEEMLGPMLLTWHNIHYYQTLMARLRTAILAGRFAAEVAAIEAGWASGDAEAAAA